MLFCVVTTVATDQYYFIFGSDIFGRKKISVHSGESDFAFISLTSSTATSSLRYFVIFSLGVKRTKTGFIETITTPIHIEVKESFTCPKNTCHGCEEK